ncbi:MAG: UDP-N-acetylglucosamine 2-epimerase (hydrolyzing) [Deltaproteobacteria bacterium]|nr:UDP-N-acetylglucosamine 2-epimerase (hydrolyzing) [Deltaproteobacteria bacterium]
MSSLTPRKVCIVVFSRANYARIKTVLRSVQKHSDLELLLVVGASALLWRYGNILETVKKDGFEIARTVHSVVDGGTPATMAKSTGLSIIELATTFENLKPDIVLTVADRYETMATAITASYMNITLAHTQGGEITGSIDESVRHSITKLSHIHFPATELAKNRLVKMGEDPDTIFLTGCPSMDILVEENLRLKADFLDKYSGSQKKIDLEKPYLLVLQHPVTTEYGQGLKQINQTLQAVKNIDMQTIWLWPNADAGTDEIAKGLRVFKDEDRDGKILFFLNFTPEDYAKILANAACIIGNSSSGIREGSFLGVPAVNIGTRQNSRERGKNTIDVKHDIKEIEDAIRKQLKHGPYDPEYLYGSGNAGERIAEVLASIDCKAQKVLYY